MKKLLLVFIILCSFKITLAQTSINITYANDSLDWTGCGVMPASFTEFNLMAEVNGYNPNDTFYIKTLFGDGTFSTVGYNYASNGFIYGQGYTDHNYFTSNAFDVTYIVTGPDGNADTLLHPAEVITNVACAGIIFKEYFDKNSNCIFDIGDSLIYNISVIVKNGISTIANFYPGLSGIGPIGYNLTAYIDVSAIQLLGYNVSCPASGFVNFNHNGVDTIYFAIDCNNSFDLRALSSVDKFKVGNSSLISTAINNISCLPQSGSYAVTLDPKLSFVYALNPPASIVGNTLTWNFSNLGNTYFGSNIPAIWNMFYANLDPSAQIGDTLCYTVTVTPTVGDFNPADNTFTLCSPVKSAWDPNYIDVSPEGVGPKGIVAPGTQFTYTIGFQNTGNDTATNIFVIDTLDSDLDINTLEILFASHPMELVIVNSHTLKFQFDNIMLPDSNTNEMLSHGLIFYRIKHKQGIPNGTQINNTAHIFFDYNPDVITNTTLNTIDISLGIENVLSSRVMIYPNPASDFVTISFEKEGTHEIVLTDLLGKELFRKKLNDKVAKVDVQQLNNGVYFLSVNDKDFQLNKKLVISK